MDWPLGLYVNSSVKALRERGLIKADASRIVIAGRHPIDLYVTAYTGSAELAVIISSSPSHLVHGRPRKECPSYRGRQVFRKQASFMIDQQVR